MDILSDVQSPAFRLVTRQRVAALRRHIEATLGPADQLLLDTRMVNTSNAFEVRGDSRDVSKISRRKFGNIRRRRRSFLSV